MEGWKEGRKEEKDRREEGWKGKGKEGRENRWEEGWKEERIDAPPSLS
jgi:hypothetical protein